MTLRTKFWKSDFEFPFADQNFMLFVVEKHKALT